jgi:hypothetical protein
MNEPQAPPTSVTLAEAAQIIGCTYERVRQLARSGVFGVRRGKVERATVLWYALERADKAAKEATSRHARALDRLYAANRQLARLRGMLP